MAEWSFLTNHARALVCIAHDPGVRLRDIGATLGITERSAFGIVTELTTAGYVVKEKDGRRNRYRIQAHLSLRCWDYSWTPELVSDPGGGGDPGGRVSLSLRVASTTAAVHKSRGAWGALLLW